MTHCVGKNWKAPASFLTTCCQHWITTWLLFGPPRRHCRFCAGRVVWGARLPREAAIGRETAATPDRSDLPEPMRCPRCDCATVDRSFVPRLQLPAQPRSSYLLTVSQYYFTGVRRTPGPAGIAHTVVQGFLPGDLQRRSPSQPPFTSSGHGFGVARRACVCGLITSLRRFAGTS